MQNVSSYSDADSQLCADVHLCCDVYDWLRQLLTVAMDTARHAGNAFRTSILK